MAGDKVGFIDMKKDSLEYVYGIHAVIELIESGKDVEAVYLNRSTKSPRLTELRKLIKQHAIPSKDLPPQAFNKYGNKNHQGIVAIVSPVQYVDIELLIPKLFEEGKMPFVLVLDHLTDVRNFGAICRSASCFGVDAIVIPGKGSAIINEFAVKSSAGAIFHLAICRVKSLNKSVEFLKNSGIRVSAISEKGKKSHFEGNFDGPQALVMGSEEKGINPALLNMADDVLRIPMEGPIESLNVSVACGILLSEAYKHRIKVEN